MSEKSKYNSFVSIIKDIFKKISKGSGLDNFNFICRNPNTIIDFIYKPDMISGGISKNLKNKKNFDKLDIIFIDGKETYVPWDDKSNILCEFIKLCKLSNKIIYMGGVAFEILIYYLATGTLNEYNFINSKGEIKAIEEMATIPTKLFQSLKRKDNFLDFVTGDILEYRNIEQTWVPIKNIGLHKKITAEKYMSRGKFVLSDKFKGKDFIKNNFAYTTICNEIKVIITRQYLSHYLIEFLPLEFIVYSSLTWFPHFVNVSNKKYQYKIICESERGPIIIEHENSVGMGFHVNLKYKDSVTLLENFIKSKFNEVRDKMFKFKNNENEICFNKKNGETPTVFKFLNFSIDDNKEHIKSFEDYSPFGHNTNMDKVANSLAFNRIKKVKSEAHHVGFGFNNRDMIFVENNFICQKQLFCGIKKHKSSLQNFSLNSNNKQLNDVFINKKLLVNTKKRNASSYGKKLNLIINNNNEYLIDKNYIKSRNDLNKKNKLQPINIFNKTTKEINKNSTHSNFIDFSNKASYRLEQKKSKTKKKILLSSSSNNFNEQHFKYYISKYPMVANITPYESTHNNKKVLDLELLNCEDNKNDNIESVDISKTNTDDYVKKRKASKSNINLHFNNIDKNKKKIIGVFNLKGFTSNS